MEKKVVHLWPALEEQFGFSQAFQVKDTIYFAGTVALDEAGEVVAPDDMRGQLRQVYANIRKTLERLDASLANVVEETIFVTDLAAITQCVDERIRAYGGSEPPPAAAVEVKALQLPGLVVEIKGSARV